MQNSADDHRWVHAALGQCLPVGVEWHTENQWQWLHQG